LEKCGFVNVKVEDCSELYQQYCRKEIEIAEKNRANPNSVIEKKQNKERFRNEFLSFFLLIFRN